MIKKLRIWTLSLSLLASTSLILPSVALGMQNNPNNNPPQDIDQGNNNPPMGQQNHQVLNPQVVQVVLGNQAQQQEGQQQQVQNYPPIQQLDLTQLMENLTLSLSNVSQCQQIGRPFEITRLEEALQLVDEIRNPDLGRNNLPSRIAGYEVSFLYYDGPERQRDYRFLLSSANDHAPTTKALNYLCAIPRDGAYRHLPYSAIVGELNRLSQIDAFERQGRASITNQIETLQKEIEDLRPQAINACEERRKILSACGKESAEAKAAWIRRQALVGELETRESNLKVLRESLRGLYPKVVYGEEVAYLFG